MMKEKLEPINPTKHRAPRAWAKAMLKLYRDPRRHTKRSYFADAYGAGTVRQHRAVSCCLLGGVRLFTDNSSYSIVNEALRDMTDQLYACVPSYVNDVEGLEAVRRVLKEMSR